MSPPAVRRAATKAARQAARAASSPSSSSPAAATDKPTPKWKYMLYTATFAAVTFTGTIYGAGLKTQKEWREEKQRIQRATTDEKVALLEARRAELVRQRDEIEAKLGELRARMRADAAGEPRPETAPAFARGSRGR